VETAGEPGSFNFYHFVSPFSVCYRSKVPDSSREQTGLSKKGAIKNCLTVVQIFGGKTGGLK
jgi:hypothetical protein